MLSFRRRRFDPPLQMAPFGESNGRFIVDVVEQEEEGEQVILAAVCGFYEDAIQKLFLFPGSLLIAPPKGNKRVPTSGS